MASSQERGEADDFSGCVFIDLLAFQLSETALVLHNDVLILGFGPLSEQLRQCIELPH